MRQQLWYLKAPNIYTKYTCLQDLDQGHSFFYCQALKLSNARKWIITETNATLLRTSGLGSFCSSTAAVRVSSLRAAMWRAGRRTFPLVPKLMRRATTFSWPCCRATASGVKPSWHATEKSTHYQQVSMLPTHFREKELMHALKSCWNLLSSIIY